MEQITINYEAGLADAYETCREYCQALCHQQGRPQKAIAADMDLSPSHLSRKLAQSPDDSMKFTLDDLERFMRVNNDTRPLVYLIEKFMAAPDAAVLKNQIKILTEQLHRLEGQNEKQPQAVRRVS